MAARPEVDKYYGLDRLTLLDMYKNIYMSRRIDDKEIRLKSQNKIFFQISGAGHEGVLVAAAQALRPSYDWFFPHYRDRALCLSLGVTAADMLKQATGAADDPSSGGRQMPSHWGSKRLNIVTRSSPTGTQFLQAVGCAEAQYRAEKIGLPQELIASYHPDGIVYVSSGEGTTSEGEFFESLNTACNLKLPLLYVIEDNGYAISTPVEVQTAGGNISKLVRSFPNLLVEEVDGCDPLASYEVLRRAAEYCRRRQGPALVHAHVIRPYSHSLSDDEGMYRPKAEREAEARRDPFHAFASLLIREGVASEQDIARLKQNADEEVDAAGDEAVRAPKPAPETATLYIYSPDVDPTSDKFSTEAEQRPDSAQTTMVDLINACLRDEMQQNARILVFGEDVADCSREGNLREVKGKGGVFKVTAGLQREFGPARSFNTPLAEAAILGRAIGMATRGLKPVAEIQFFDYIWPAMMQIRDELATLRWRSNGGFSCPAVIRVAIGGYLNGGAIYHSQCGEVEFTHIPGLRVVMPSNALDACGLLRTALRADDPVLFLEHKRLYREPYNRSPHPGEDFTIPFGLAKVVKPGHSLTVVTYGALVQKSLLAASQIERRNARVSVEIIDLRTLAPYDWEAIRQSVEKTSRVLITHEDTLSWGYGAEIAARIGDELFGKLDAPVRRVGALDTWIGYHPRLEAAILPQTETLTAEMERLLAY